MKTVKWRDLESEPLKRSPSKGGSGGKASMFDQRRGPLRSLRCCTQQRLNAVKIFKLYPTIFQQVPHHCPRSTVRACVIDSDFSSSDVMLNLVACI